MSNGIDSYRNLIFCKYVSGGYGNLNRRNLIAASETFTQHFGPFLPEDRQSRILEIGCGMGHFQDYLQRQGYRNRIAIDIGPEQIAFCKEHIEGDFHLVDDTLAFVRNHQDAFDLVVMNDLIEHFTKKELTELMIAVRESLALGGTVIMRTPNMANPHAAFSRYGDFTHEIGFNERSAEQFFNALGFSQTTCHSEEPWIRSRWKRNPFGLARSLYYGLMRLAWILDRPGDHHPRILSKNLIIRAIR